ncbi:MAG: hypothetical protein ACE5WD_11890 [Candidatus Aminicenantia bacterium]
MKKEIAKLTRLIRRIVIDLERKILLISMGRFSPQSKLIPPC